MSVSPPETSLPITQSTSNSQKPISSTPDQLPSFPTRNGNQSYQDSPSTSTLSSVDVTPPNMTPNSPKKSATSPYQHKSCPHPNLSKQLVTGLLRGTRPQRPQPLHSLTAAESAKTTANTSSVSSLHSESNITTLFSTTTEQFKNESHCRETSYSLTPQSLETCRSNSSTSGALILRGKCKRELPNDPLSNLQMHACDGTMVPARPAVSAASTSMSAPTVVTPTTSTVIVPTDPK
jgi:hypothetical protein